MGEGGQADDPFDRFVVFTTRAQQVEERGEKNHLQKHDEQHTAAQLSTKEARRPPHLILLEGFTVVSFIPDSEQS